MSEKLSQDQCQVEGCRNIVTTELQIKGPEGKAVSLCLLHATQVANNSKSFDFIMNNGKYRIRKKTL